MHAGSPVEVRWGRHLTWTTRAWTTSSLTYWSMYKTKKASQEDTPATSRHGAMRYHHWKSDAQGERISIIFTQWLGSSNCRLSPVRWTLFLFGVDESHRVKWELGVWRRRPGSVSSNSPIQMPSFRTQMSEEERRNSSHLNNALWTLGEKHTNYHLSSLCIRWVFPFLLHTSDWLLS